MISIITAIHNQLDVNIIFLNALKTYTTTPYELIIIDNCSTDGSADFFEKNGAVVIRNEKNYSYPYSQNQGIAKAQYHVYVFLNNDIVVSPNWDVHLLQVLGKNNYHAVSFASNERMVNPKKAAQINGKYKRIKFPLLFLFGNTGFALRFMLRVTYGNWGRFCQRIFSKYGLTLSEGFSGSAIALDKIALDKIGLWDERIQAADFDLYNRTKQRHQTEGDIMPLSIIGGVYIHHFARLTSGRRRTPPVFADAQNLISIADKWKEKATEYAGDLKQ